jgi:hypothetical protein
MHQTMASAIPFLRGKKGNKARKRKKKIKAKKITSVSEDNDLKDRRETQIFLAGNKLHYRTDF